MPVATAQSLSPKSQYRNWMCNDILAEAEQRLEAQVTPENHSDYLRTVVAGMKLALKNGLDGVWGSLDRSSDPVRDCAICTVDLVHMMKRRKQTCGVSPETVDAAATTLMLKALDFAARARLVNAGPAELVRATQILDAALARHPHDYEPTIAGGSSAWIN